MTYEDTLQDHITDLYLQVQDLKKRGIKADEAIRGLERRIDRIDGMLDGMGKGAESRIEAMEGRIAAIERKLAHKTREDA